MFSTITQRISQGYEYFDSRLVCVGRAVDPIKLVQRIALRILLSDPVWVLDPRIKFSTITQRISQGYEYFDSWLVCVGRAVDPIKLVQRIALRILLSDPTWVLDPRKPLNCMQRGAIEFFAKGIKGTFDNASLLPRLPIPSLNSTFSQYKRSIKHLVSEEEFKETEKLINRFVGWKGLYLNAKLYLYSLTKTCWVEEMWLKIAYLRTREPLNISSSWYGGDSLAIPYQYPKETIQASRLARLSTLIFQTHQQIENNTYPPLDISICMNPYKYLFGTTRIPGKEMDELVTSKSNHIVVLINNLIYKLNIFHEGELLREAEFFNQYQHILEDAQKYSTDPAVSLLTCDERASWAKNRQILKASNSENLRIIETALLAFRLSDKAPETIQEKADIGIKDYHNVWLDKAVVVTCCKNGSINATNEHSPMDADTVALAIDRGFAMEADPRRKIRPARDVALPQRLQWNLSPQLVRTIERIDLETKQRVANLDLKVQKFNNFCRDRVKKLGLSPDSYVQMALQWTYFQMHGEMTLTYETAGTRFFRHGRTETMRSSTPEAYAMCKALASDVNDSDKAAAIKHAIETHEAMRRRCGIGQGFDRHILGLRVLDQNKDPLFQTRAMNLPFKMATSQTPCKHSTGGGFYPVCEEGYGISYFPRKRYLLAHISSHKSAPKTDSSEFAQTLEKTLDLFQNLLSI